MKFVPRCLGWLAGIALVSAGAALAQVQEDARQAQPNILLLYADDWRHDTLGVAGHPIEIGRAHV